MAFKQTDPAKFVVRDDRFNQTLGYPEFAADLVDFMLGETIPGAEVLYRIIGGAIEEQNKKQRFNNGPDWHFFGKIREDDPAQKSGMYSATVLVGGRFADGFRERLMATDPKHPFGWQFSHKDEESGVQANLGFASNQQPGVAAMFNKNGPALPPNTPFIIHPNVDDENWQAIKWLMEKEFVRAVSGSLSPEERKDAALDTTSLLAHAMPTYRGGSIVMTVGLEYLAARAGFETDFFKERCDLYTKAALQDPAEFRENYKSGKYADPKADGKEIMEWHKQQLETGFELRQ